MKAVQCKAFGGFENLTLESVPEPKPQPGEILVRIKAAGVNFPDILMVAGAYQVKPPLPFTPGFEAAGIVEGLGGHVRGFKRGDHVVLSAPWGAWAAQIAVPAQRVFRIPKSMPFESAAVFPTVFGTVCHALVQRAELKKGETLAVPGAAGGVGLAAVQVGKAMGARVIAAAGDTRKLEIAEKHGADECINYSESNLKDRLKELTKGEGVDVVLDPVGGSLTEPALRALAWGGRLLIVGFAGGAIPSLPMNLPLLKGASIVGVHWTAFIKNFPDVAKANFQKLLRWYQGGKIKPLISGTYPMENVVEALRIVRDRAVTGKVVLIPPK
ncbi:MAG: NADPH:quinone oxidoreductase family protein [Pseudomonadota bacterium]